jgi:enoyl-CoA hydratase/carnithine racemase
MTTPPELAVGWGDDGVCTVTLNRPGRGQCALAGLVAALESALDAAAARKARLVVLRGEGRHFCTGFDLSRLDEESDDSLLARFCRIELDAAEGASRAVPDLAIAHGRTVGAGRRPVRRVHAPRGRARNAVRLPGASGFGLVLGTRRLVQRVGAERARRWVETGATIGLDEALAAGLATGTLADASGADDIARCLAAEHPPPSIPSSARRSTPPIRFMITSTSRCSSAPRPSRAEGRGSPRTSSAASSTSSSSSSFVEIAMASILP